MMRSLAMPACAALMLLTACDTSMEVVPSVAVLSKRVTIPSERVVGDQLSVVRAYALDANGKRAEVGNAVCTVRSRELSGRVTTPQAFRYPVFLQAARFKDRGRPSPLEVTCRANGTSTTARVLALPKVPNRTTQTSYGANGQPSVQTSTLYGQLASSYPWGYPTTIAVTLP